MLGLRSASASAAAPRLQLNFYRRVPSALTPGQLSRRTQSTTSGPASTDPPTSPTSPASPSPSATVPTTLRTSPILRPWSSIPSAPKYLGLAGLLPFLGTALGAYTCVPTDILGFQMLQATYGASILSFMGAIHWGTGMSATGPQSTVNSRYILSTVPCLVGFVSLNLPPDVALVVQSAGFSVLAAWDTRAWKRGEVPEWYPTLRYLLTGVVVATLGGTWWAGKRPIKGLAFELGNVPEKKKA
ncbi:hypothetical protein BCR44DRAFT_1388003 [Catenaria anguillulae PL171]|uniref:DUF3429 domain-containing protein n=1 Tax=Catenaria anguillulae PL171 TaxID=765915 RepID=A0A1Y2HY02_9FUNG|nr:hypothetical protein BCR44DRAFT_1388003 [Catenaria anguillulae PL171]